MLPRRGFLRESRSSPIIGPGLGRQMSNRFEKSFPQGPDTVGYDLPAVEKYKLNGSASVTRFGEGFGHLPKARDIADLIPRPAGADVDFYDVPPVRCSTAPRIGPGEGRPMSPRSPQLVPPGCGADTMYDLPSPDVYHPRMPGVPRWDPGFARFPKTHKYDCDTQYDEVPFDVYRKIGSACTTRIGSSGPRIDPAQYRIGEGADALYSIPPMNVVKPSKTSTVHRFGAPIIRGEAIVPHRIPSAEAPPWLGRLASYKPRPRTPWNDKHGAQQILSNTCARKVRAP